MNWREIWKRKHEERAGKDVKRKLGPGYWDKVAEVYSEWAKFDDCQYGRKTIEAMKEIIDPSFEILDIGAGPGTLAVPFARTVRKVTAIEPSRAMIRCLVHNAKKEGVRNIEIINKNWLDVDDFELRKKFDVVVCSHLLWQFRDVNEQLKRMEGASRGYCSVVHLAGGRDPVVGDLWFEIVGKEYHGELDPDLDDLIFVALRERGVLVNVRVIDFTSRVPVELEAKHVEFLLAKHTEITPIFRELIKKRVLERSKGGFYEKKGKAVVMWWRVPAKRKEDD